MARIRTVKPESWGDEKLAPLPPITRLVFLGLISQADDTGRLMDSVRYIDGLLFSRTDDSCAESLVVLNELGVIERGLTASGQPIIQITNWTRHQKIEKPNFKGALPPLARSKRRSRATNGTHPDAESLPESSGNDRGEVGEASGNDSTTPPLSDLRPSTFDLGPTTNDLRPTTDDLDRGTDDPPSDDPERPVGRSVESLRSPVNGEQPDPLAGFNAVGSRLAALQLPGGYQAAAELVAGRYLWPEGIDLAHATEAMLIDLPLPERERVVLDALADYRNSGESFKPRLFAGYVERLRKREQGTTNGNGAGQAEGNGIVKRHLAVESADGPEPTPEARAEIARMAAETKAALRGGGSVPPAVQAERERKLAVVAKAERRPVKS